MAHKFPHVAVIGIDLAPGILDQDNVPSNCRIELDDVNRGLPHFYGQVDLVHMRSVASGVSVHHHQLISQSSFLSIIQISNISMNKLC
jgi:hypothetical protein